MDDFILRSAPYEGSVIFASAAVIVHVPRLHTMVVLANCYIGGWGFCSLSIRHPLLWTPAAAALL